MVPLPVRNRDQIKQDEKNLLEELVRNGKQNIDIIAKNCGFSKQKSWRMIKKIETEKLIWGYTAIFDEQKMGLKHFTLLVKKNGNPVKEKTIDSVISRTGDELSKKIGTQIENSYLVLGEYDWISTFLAKGIIDAKKHIDAVWGDHYDEIEKLTLLQTLMFVKKQNIPNPEKNKLQELI